MRRLATAALVLAPALAGAQPYVEIGAMAYARSLAAPRVTLGSPIGFVEAGYTFRRQMLGASVSVYVRHASGLLAREPNSYGVNAAGVKGRWEFGDGY